MSARGGPDGLRPPVPSPDPRGAAGATWVGVHRAVSHAAHSLTRPHTAPADPTLTRGRSVINVIVPEGRAHFFQQLGYVLATLLLFILLLITVILATRQRRRGGEHRSEARTKPLRPEAGLWVPCLSTGGAGAGEPLCRVEGFLRPGGAG